MKSEGLAKNTAILGIGVFLSKVISFFVVPFFSRWLSVDDYGTFDLVNTLVALVVPLVTMSCGEALFRFLIDAKGLKDKKKIVSNSLLVYLSGWIFGLIISVPVCVCLLDINLYPFFVLYLTADVIYNFALALARGLKETKTYAFAGVYYIVALSIISFLFVRIYALGLRGLILSYALSYILSAVITLVKCRMLWYVEGGCIQKKEVKGLLVYSIPTMPNSISWWIMQVSDRIVISVVIGNVFNGIYAIANYIPAICTTFFNAFHLSWQQDVSERINDSEKGRYISGVMNKSMQSIISLCCGVLSGAYFVIKIMFSSEYYEAYNQVAILVFASLVSFFAQFFGGVLVGLKNTKILGATTVIAAVVNLVTNLLLIKWIGLYAASISTLICYIVLFVIRFVIIYKSIPLKVNAKTLLLFSIFVYFFISYYLGGIILRVINLVISGILFICINFDMVKKLLRR